MPGFDLVITFSGLCTFVPEPENRRMWVFLQNHKRKNGILPHRSAIRFRSDRLEGVENLGAIEGVGAIDVADNVTALWLLDRHDIRILPDGDPDLEIAGAGDLKNLDGPTDTSPEGSFSFVAPIETACRRRGLAPGGGVVKPELLKLPHLESLVGLESVAGRILLTQGGVRARVVPQLHGQKRRDIFWRFRPSSEGSERDGDLVQKIASRVVLTRHIESESVTLEATHLNNSNVSRGRVTLRPFDGKVELDVLSEEADRLVGNEVPAERIFKGKPRRQDQVFSSVFDLVVNPPARRRMPGPVPERFVEAESPGGTADGSPPCAPRQLQGGI